ncbi:MAG: hypothetical protein ACREL7_06205 [Longimicrobiales bacterium]
MQEALELKGKEHAMSKRQFVITHVLALAAVAVCSSQLRAQDCGNGCEDCGFFGMEGVNHSPNGEYHMDCDNWQSFCNQCGFQVAGRDGLSTSEILRIASSAPVSELDAVVMEFGDRLVLNQKRNLLGVRATSFGAETLQLMAFVPPDRSAALAQLGVQSIGAFLAMQERPPIVGLAVAPRNGTMGG